MKDIVVFSGVSHPNLTERICRDLSLERGKVELKKFSNGETAVTIKDSVREKDVFIVQSGCGHVNDNFIQLLVMISACKTSSAKRVTAVLPFFPYSRQSDAPYNHKGSPLTSTKKSEYTFDSIPSTPRPMSRSDFTTSGSTAAQNNIINNNTNPSLVKSTYQPKQIATNASSVGSKGFLSITGYKSWNAQSGTLIANLLTCAGADQIITMDLHDPQYQGFFDIPFDNLYSKPLLQHYIQQYIPNYKDAVVVSPDSGGAKRATAIADNLGMSFALIHKERRHKVDTPSLTAQAINSLEQEDKLVAKSQKLIATTMLVGDVTDKVCILIDDLVDTSYTITRASKLLKDQGASYVYAIVTHGIFSGDAIRRIKQSNIDKLISTNTVPQEEHVKELGDMLEVLDVSRLFGEAIRRIHNGESVSMLFDHGW
ncbi:hypothetical protein PACTADRAFT_42145 [Pachysolen tannophilus NRRL Y-2460]|uniref:ribose-phosphate diphosphokinase n=1 Tax=Pachysolen tannophilus NRRL Y-2460 TaxID=669874 RepID=A0A1E4TUJ9_PACTA|nr:hypothetical protein PACTADRAFT_42145 [Pachysolen tannophilus NRRL Y-2460]